MRSEEIMFLAHAYYHRDVRVKVVLEVREKLAAAFGEALADTLVAFMAKKIRVMTFPVNTARDQMDGDGITIFIWGELPADLDRNEFRQRLFTVCCRVIPCPIYGTLTFYPTGEIGPIQVGDIG